jgi:hypothetical protein
MLRGLPDILEAQAKEKKRREDIEERRKKGEIISTRGRKGASEAVAGAATQAFQSTLEDPGAEKKKTSAAPKKKEAASTLGGPSCMGSDALLKCGYKLSGLQLDGAYISYGFGQKSFIAGVRSVVCVESSVPSTSIRQHGSLMHTSTFGLSSCYSFVLRPSITCGASIS